MNRQAILDVLNSLEAVDTIGGVEAYILVDSSKENLRKLNEVGVTDEVIFRYGDKETFCILALAFSEGYADGYSNGKLFFAGLNNFRIEDIDGCEFVKSRDVGKMLISFHKDYDGYPTGKILVVYADGSQGAINQEEAQEKFDSGSWEVIN